MRTQNLCYVQKYEKYQNFLSENLHFLVVKFSIYLNRHAFVMFIPYIFSLKFAFYAVISLDTY